MGVAVVAIGLKNTIACLQICLIICYSLYDILEKKQLRRTWRSVKLQEREREKVDWDWLLTISSHTGVRGPHMKLEAASSKTNVTRYLPADRGWICWTPCHKHSGCRNIVWIQGRWVHGSQSEGFQVDRISLQFRKQFEARRRDVSRKFALLLLCPGQITPELVYHWWAWAEVSCNGNQSFLTLVHSNLIKIDTVCSPSKSSMSIFTVLHEFILSLIVFIFTTCLKCK